MPKPKHLLNLFIKKELKWRIQDKIGFNITNKLDCKKLSELIRDENLPVISESTLYRIFLVDNHKSTPYLHTLNILAQFIKYSDWESLSKIFNDRAYFQMKYGQFANEDKFTKSLITCCIESNDLTPFIDFCEHLPANLSNEETHLIGEEIYCALLNTPNPDQNIDFFRSTSHLPIIRKAFFEFMADPGFKIPHYRFGLECYINNIKDQYNIQDFIFAKSLLLLDYIYKNDSVNALIIAEELYEKKTYSEEELNSIHIYPCIRFLSYRIFHIELQGEPTTNYLDYLFKYIQSRYEAWDHLEKRIVFHTLCETFFLCQTNTESQEKKLKELFKDLYLYYPDYFNEASLQELLVYFNTNSAATYL